MPKNYKALLERKTALDAEINVLEPGKAKALQAAHQLVREENRDLFGAGPLRQDTGRYRNPKTGETWSGRGRPPRWIEGRDRKPFEA
ncbi:MAG: H-NS family nucleoid-associated regulatory protein [Pseudomonadales bacterium]|jgi:DNA-binding protein H-NS|uniref:H-NS family nucleoid-associated regulatory protein n=1 Tax=Delftia tsuruhatensis TaxID=180282 RepID=A0AAX3SKB7_9BURK|nr:MULTISPECIES: H-NS family nucleoid-associated regulatory protein [Delftia]WFF80572.1 H-NS family nucleoid-associated regulatory protein [Delftia tsuruhatensis]